ncbi:MAG TPA: Mov34/MPN/PAD-1 family protein [Candidatus Angelobacter sp.]|nr:Mov34/MPN/PAD-1 family protein [Candidatus Angelobacter sp.]
MAKAAKVKVRVSTQPVVVMESEVARQIRQHARSSMKAEVCGILIGSTEHERMTVEACIQGINAAQGGAHVTFTQDTWEHIYKIKDKEYPDQKIVGWYHSHPGFGVFLSEHDLFIQQNFFSNAQQVAWVYDPHTDEEGCFGWVGDKIEKLTAIRVGYLQNIDPGASAAGGNGYHDYDEDGALDPSIQLQSEREKEEPAWLRWTSLALGYLAAVVLGVAVGFLVHERQTASDVETVKEIKSCDQIQWQSMLCQDLLIRLVPSLLVPVHAVPQNGAAPAAQPSAAPAAPGAPPASPAKSPQSSPPHKPSVEKGNNGKQ